MIKCYETVLLSYLDSGSRNFSSDGLHSAVPRLYDLCLFLGHEINPTWRICRRHADTLNYSIS